MILLNRETLIFLGIAVLLVNIVVSAALRRKFQAVNAIVAIAACVIVIVGIAQVTLLPAAASTRNARGSAPVAADTTAPAGIPNRTTGANTVGNANSASSVSFNSAGANVAPQIQVPTAQGNSTAAATGAASTSGSVNTNTTNSRNSAGGTSASGDAAASASPVSTLVAAARAYVPFLTIAGGLLILFAGMLHYASERQQTTFRRSRSLGFLNIGIGVLIVAFMIFLPIIVTQASGSARAAAAAVTPTNGPAPTRQNMVTPTPTQMPAPSATPSALPSLTPTPSPTPIVLSTQIPYTTPSQSTAVTNCSVSAQTLMNLRALPSTSQSAIGRILAGSLLKVTGKSADGQWFHVITGDNVEGWVSVQYVTKYSGCTAASVPVVTDIPARQ